MKQLKIEYISLKKLIPYARNARQHSDKQIAQIAASIQEFGFSVPVLINNHDGLIAGHGRILAAQLLKMKIVPCVRLTHLSDVQGKALNIVDNQLALNATWNEELLRLEIEDLKDVDFNLSVLGLSNLDEILGAIDPNVTKDLDLDNMSEFLVVIECDDEEEQEKIYEELQEREYKCKIM